MKNLNDLVVEMVESELEIIQGVVDENIEDVDAALVQMSNLIDELGKIVGLDIYYLRQNIRKKNARRQAA